MNSFPTMSDITPPSVPSIGSPSLGALGATPGILTAPSSVGVSLTPVMDPAALNAAAIASNSNTAALNAGIKASLESTSAAPTVPGATDGFLDKEDPCVSYQDFDPAELICFGPKPHSIETKIPPEPVMPKGAASQAEWADYASKKLEYDNAIKNKDTKITYHTFTLNIDRRMKKEGEIIPALIEGPVMTSKYGASDKVMSGKTVWQIGFELDSKNPDHQVFTQKVDALYMRCGQIIKDFGADVGQPQFNAENPESSNLKRLIFIPIDKNTKKPLPTNPILYTKFSNKKTNMTVIKCGKTVLPWAAAKNCFIRCIPLFQCSIYVGSKPSIQWSLRSMVVLEISANNSNNIQSSTVRRVTAEDPEYEQRIAAQVAKVMNARQEALIKEKEEAAAKEKEKEAPKEEGKSAPTFTGIGPTQSQQMGAAQSQQMGQSLPPGHVQHLQGTVPLQSSAPVSMQPGMYQTPYGIPGMQGAPIPTMGSMSSHMSNPMDPTNMSNFMAQGSVPTFASAYNPGGYNGSYPAALPTNGQ